MSSASTVTADIGLTYLDTLKRVQREIEAAYEVERAYQYSLPERRQDESNSEYLGCALSALNTAIINLESVG